MINKRKINTVLYHAKKYKIIGKCEIMKVELFHVLFYVTLPSILRYFFMWAKPLRITIIIFFKWNRCFLDIYLCMKHKYCALRIQDVTTCSGGETFKSYSLGPLSLSQLWTRPEKRSKIYAKVSTYFCCCNQPESCSLVAR